MNKRFTILMLLMALFVPWTAKAQETKTIHVVPDRGGDRGTMTVYKRVTSLTSGRNYLIVNSATANSDASALSQVSSTASSITASFVHISPGISATSNAAYIANLADPTAVWTATSSGSNWRFSHYNNGSTYYIYTDRSTLTANTSSTNWTYSNNGIFYHYEVSIWGIVITSTDYYITPSTSGFSLSEDEANVYLFEQTNVTAYDVTADVSPAGIGRVTGAGQYPAGATCTLTASTLNNEYAFSNWTVNGTVVSTNPIYTFTVNDDQNVVANYESIATCPSPTNLTAGTPYAHSVPLAWASDADNFNVRYRTIGAGETQTFYDSFENGLGNWTVIRSGGGTDNTDWQQYSGGHHDINPHTGSYVAMSRSWANNNAYSVDNWLITPQVTLNGTLSFWAAGDANFPEFYEVYVSTTGNDINDFNWYYSPPTVTESWTQVNVDLSSFNGASGYIALRHTDTDKDFLYIDDFSIYSQSYGDWSQLIPANGTTFTLTGLESQIQYQVQVQANCGDELSSWSKPVNFTTTAPSTAAPTNLAVDVNSITAYSATVSWQGVAANDSHLYYQVYYAESDINSVPYSPAEPNLIDSINETTFTLSELAPETEYHVWVRDYCGEDGYSPWTSYQTFTTLVSCPSPTELTVRDVTSHGASIEWTGIGDNYQYYQLYYADSTVTIVPDSLAMTNLIDSISEASYTLSGLVSETEYHVWVRAYCGEYDGFSVWTPYQAFTTAIACPAPTDVTVSDVTAHGATVTWTDSGDSYQYYQLYYADSTVTIVPDSLAMTNLIDSISEAAYTLSGLISETEYHVWVRAYCGDDDGYSDWTSYQTFTTLVSCPSPTELTVRDVTSHAATIEWTGIGDNYQHYQLYYADSTVTFVPDSLAFPNFVDSISGAAYTLSGLLSETIYHVWVRAYCGDDDGYSDWTSYQTFTTLVSCPAPSGLAVVENSISGHDATVSWDRAATQETGLVFFNYVCVALGDTLNWDNASILIDDVDNPNPPTVNLTDLVPETEYNFYVRKDCNEEGFSREVMISFTTEIACPTPTDLTIVESSITGHTATVSWTDASYGQQYYQVYYAESNITSVPDSLAAPNLIDSISVTSYTLSGLHSETEYHVWVRSYCGDDDGYSAWTPYQTFTTLVSCFPPTDVTITNETGHGATIEWNGTSDSYLVMVGESEQSITYSYDFEDGTSQGWTTLKGSNGTSPNNWMHISEYSYAYNYEAMSSGHGHNGSDGYMYSESYISGESQGSGTAVYPDNYLVSPQIALGGSITFHAGGQNVSYCAEQFSLMVSTTGNDAVDNFTTVQTWIFTPTASSGNEWQEFTVDLGAYSGMGYVAIRHFDCYDQWFLCIDDITIESGPMDPSWMTYEAEESPFVLYDATNIHPESTYSIQMIGICNDEESRPSVTTSFTTTIACPAPTELAVVENSITGHGATFEWQGNSESYVVSYRISSGTNMLLEENFESEDSFADWTFTSMNTANNIASGYAGRNANAAHSGSYGFRFSSFSSAENYNQYLVSPRLTRTGELKFYYKKYNTNDSESLKVGYSTTTNDLDSFTWTNLELSTSWQEYSQELPFGVKYIAFHYYGDYAYYVYVDDITISEFVPAGEWQPVTTDEVPFTLTNLAPETTYEVIVQCDCGDDGVSTESNTVTFTTLVSCPAPIPLDPTDVTSSSAVLNWDGDAESYNVSYYKTFFFDSFEEDLSQWTIYKNGDEASFEWGIENPHDNSSDLNAHSGFFAAVAYSDTDIHADSWLVTPQILLPSQTTLKFWIMRSTYDDAQDEYEVRLSTSGNAIEDFDDIILKPKTVANSYWTEEVIDLSEYDGLQVYIAIRHDYTSGFFIMVDDFGIFGWSEPITTTDNSLAIEDLLPETEYQWQVQANCGEEDGLSHWSEISTLTTLRACPIPFYLEAYDETAYGATIDWTGFSDSYVVMVRENEDEEAPSSYSYDFEDGTLQGWTILKGTTGDSPNNWMLASEYPTSVNDISSGHGHNSSDGFMLSESYIYGETQSSGTPVTPDNYLVSPQVWLGGSITFYAGTPDASFRNEKFSVMVSTTGNDAVSNFTAVQTWTSITTETSGTAWKQYTVDLSAFSGKGYIAIRHFDCRDQWLLCIDDITIENGPVIPTWFTYEAGTSPFVLYDPENLSAETTYLVKVKGFCGDEATDFSDNITFTTLDENTKIFITEGDWSDDYNWVPVGIPSIEQNVILRAEATVFDVAEANAITVDNAGMLTIEDGGQLKTNNDVEATMKKFIIGYGTDYVETNDGYYLMALPTADPISAADAGLITEESEYDLYSWDRTATDEEWHNNHDSLDIENGLGFLYANQDDREMSFTALLRNSSESIVVTPDYDEVEHGGWNLYGNPFPCEVYITTEAEGMTFYRLIGNELVPIDWAIAPMEAFFVKATAAGQSFTISREAPEESKSPTNGNTNRFKVSTVTK